MKMHRIRIKKYFLLFFYILRETPCFSWLKVIFTLPFEFSISPIVQIITNKQGAFSRVKKNFSQFIFFSLYWK